MGDLSTNFSRAEFACSGKGCCGGAAPVHPELIEGLQMLRDLAGVPLHINSGFRCVTHNKEVGGKSESLHTLGMAADVAVPPRMSAQQLVTLAEQIPQFRDGGIGIYSTWIHVDVRKVKARWRIA